MDLSKLSVRDSTHENVHEHHGVGIIQHEPTYRERSQQLYEEAMKIARDLDIPEECRTLGNDMETRWDPEASFGDRLHRGQYIHERNKRIIKCIENFIKYVGYNERYYKQKLSDMKSDLRFQGPKHSDWRDG